MLKVINYLQEKYDFFNKKFFNDSISIPVEFDLCTGVNEGLTEKVIEKNNKIEKVIIKINKVLLEIQFEEELENTLVHEMIHAWQIEYLHYADHLQSFKNWAIKIAKIDPNMQIARIGNEEESKRFREEIDKSSNGYLLIDKDTKKAFFLKKLSNKKIKEMLEFYDIYYSSYFGLKPQYSTLYSNNKLKAYYYTMNEIKSIINNKHNKKL